VPPLIITHGKLPDHLVVLPGLSEDIVRNLEANNPRQALTPVPRAQTFPQQGPVPPPLWTSRGAGRVYRRVRHRTRGALQERCSSTSSGLHQLHPVCFSKHLLSTYCV
jgi:hypothetical protein